METQTLHRGRLIDHLQLVVKDLAASQRFYMAALAALDIPIGGTGEGYFWADELFITAIDSPAALGALTGRHHLAFQAQDRTTVDRFYQAALANGGQDNSAPGGAIITPAITPPLCSIRTATISKRCITVRQSGVRSRWRLGFSNM
ncbi:VOC family protein [Aeromonas hydrophila]|nr:VOC family protein [Aeromonas hydrophila]MCP3323619.1 VOC family protein [Aeromonas hydrophila]